MGVAVSWSTCLRCNHTSSRHFFSVSKSCMSPVQTRLEWLQTASNQIQCNYLQYRTTKSQTVIAILCATATVVRGADGHKTDLCFGGRNQTNINQSYLYYMHHTTVKQLDITNWNLGLLLVVQWWIIISTPSFVLRWTKNLRKQGGKSLSTTLNQCPFSIMLGTPLEQAFTAESKRPPTKTASKTKSGDWAWVSYVAAISEESFPFHDQKYTFKGWVEVNLGQHPPGWILSSWFIHRSLSWFSKACEYCEVCCLNDSD